jgi:hypothetical protein
MFELSCSAGEKSGLIRAPKTPKRLNATRMLFCNVPDSYPGISGVEFCPSSLSKYFDQHIFQT